MPIEDENEQFSVTVNLKGRKILDGDRIEIIVGRLTGLLCDVVTIKGDRIEVTRSTWVISREYQADEMGV